jgi:vacuolar-type H+-ATPase subunit I/STV1
MKNQTLLQNHKNQLTAKYYELDDAKTSGDTESIPDLRNEISDILNEIKKIENNNSEYNNFINNFNKTLTK